MEKFMIKLAGHNVRIESRFGTSRSFFSDYIIPDGDAEIIASVSDEDIDATVAEVPEISREMAEFIGLYRPIAEAMPALGGFVFHGAAISFEGKGYIFTAPSGTGKSTHIRLWRKYLGNSVDIVNGDKPIITVGDDRVFVHGTPWAGKERWQKNRSVPLAGICLLRRGETCSAGLADIGDSLPFLFGQTYLSSDSGVTGRTMELMDMLLKTVPIHYLFCDISEKAARCSFEELCGERFEDHKVRIRE